MSVFTVFPPARSTKSEPHRLPLEPRPGGAGEREDSEKGRCLLLQAVWFQIHHKGEEGLENLSTRFTRWLEPSLGVGLLRVYG